MATRRQKEKKAIRYGSAKQRAEDHEKGFVPTSLNLPAGVKQWKPKEAGKTYRLRILPYRLVTPEANPYAKDEDRNPLEEGDAWYERTYFNHPFVGVDEDTYCCPKRTFGKGPCAYCKAAAAESDTQRASPLRAKERQLFNVIDMDDEEAGAQVFEYSYHNFGKQLDAKIDAKPRYASFWHLTGGFIVEVTFRKESAGTRSYLEAGNIEMEPADDLDEDILDSTHDLDAIPIFTSPEEMQKIFRGEPRDGRNGQADSKAAPKGRKAEPDDDEDEDEAPKGKKPPAKKKADPTAEDLGIEVGMTVEHGEYGTCEVKHISGDGTSLRLKDEDGETHSGVAPSEVGLSDLDEEDEAPRGKKAPPAKKTSARSIPDDEDDEEEELEEDEDDEEEDEELDEDEEDEDDEEEDEELDEDEEDEKPRGRRGGRR